MFWFMNTRSIHKDNLGIFFIVDSMYNISSCLRFTWCDCHLFPNHIIDKCRLPCVGSSNDCYKPRFQSKLELSNGWVISSFIVAVISFSWSYKRVIFKFNFLIKQILFYEKIIWNFLTTLMMLFGEAMRIILNKSFGFQDAKHLGFQFWIGRDNLNFAGHVRISNSRE